MISFLIHRILYYYERTSSSLYPFCDCPRQISSSAFVHISFDFIRSQFPYFGMRVFFIFSNSKDRRHSFAFLVLILFQK